MTAKIFDVFLDGFKFPEGLEPDQAKEGLNKSSYGAKQTLYPCLFRIQAF